MKWRVMVFYYDGWYGKFMWNEFVKATSEEEAVELAAKRQRKNIKIKKFV